jgi:hypothetical protein
VTTGHDGLCWPVVVVGGDGVDVCSSHVAHISWGVHDIVEVGNPLVVPCLAR